MPNAPVTVYDHQMRRVAWLENAFAIGYEMPLNGLWRASFSLPVGDPKNAECRPFYFVELFDERERVELFRIIPNTVYRSRDEQRVTYQCEHVLATLLDDVLFQYHTVGNLGVYTADVLQYILQRQTVERWQLGDVRFTRQFEYNWENENLLGALFSVPKPFIEAYQWTYDTTVYPWRLNLAEPHQQVETYIRYGVNMQGMEKTVDPTNLCTRLYGLGCGEGVNQLTFKELNDGKPYIEDAEAQGKYGVISQIFADRRFEYPETLLARCQALLHELKVPRVTYTVQASEIHRLTETPLYQFKTGGMVRVQDQEMGVDLTARVVNVRKRDVYGAPGDVEIEIANRSQDIAGTIADLANRQRIHEVYAQGATNLDSHDFADNCDPQHPAIMRFYIPEETARINKVRLSYRVEPFRVPVKGAAAGGGTVQSTSSGGGATQTTSSGGGTTATSSSGGAYASTTAAGGGATSGPSSKLTTSAGGGSVETTAKQIFLPGGPSEDYTVTSGKHNHGFNHGDVFLLANGEHRVFVESGSHSHWLYSHAHEVLIPHHTHGMDHTHVIPEHVHVIIIPHHTHDMTIPDHTHIVVIPVHSHEVTLPDHIHEMIYGIFEGPMPTALAVQVDGNIVPGLDTSAQDVDIVPYLSKDGSGKIQRGWHEIKIAPNDLGRIVANVNMQLFVQSRGGGDY